MTLITSPLTLLLTVGALLVVYSDVVNGDASSKVSFHLVKYGTSWGIAPGVKKLNVQFWVSATTWSAPKDSLQNLTGTGLWKLSLSARQSKDASGAPDIEQSLSPEQSSKSLSGGNLFVKAQAVLSGMGGCDGDKAYICYKLDKGDNPDPDFELNAPMTGCLNMSSGLKCKTEPAAQ